MNQLFLLTSLFFVVCSFFMALMPLPPELWPVAGLTNLLLCVPAIWAARRWLGWPRALTWFFGLGVLGMIIETIGIVTGIPYGSFLYGNQLGPKLFGITPWLLFFTWPPLVLAATAIAYRLSNSILARVVTTAGVLVVFDLVLDPGAVALGFWRFAQPGLYYNVPFTNFVGWFISGLIGAFFTAWLIPKSKQLLPAPAQLLWTAYLSLSLWTGVAFWRELWLPAALGVVVLVALAYRYKKLHYAFDDRVVLVDTANEPIATGEKLPTHTGDTVLHRGFSCFLFTDNGELLLQQRALTKKTWPGVWSNSCCGHPMLHETILAAVKRRLKFELGMRAQHLEVIVPNYKYRYERFGIVEHEICPVVVGKMRTQPKPNPAEVASAKTMPWQQFVREVETHPEQWSEWCVEETKLLAASPAFNQWFTKHCQHAA